MGRDVRRFRDAYGQTAVAVPNSYDMGWKLTIIRKRRNHSYTRNCRSIQHAMRVLDVNGHSWTEV